MVKECPLCQQELVSKLHVKEHIRDHKIDKAYGCAKCEVHTAEWPEMLDHLTSEHNESNFTEKIHWNNMTPAVLIKNVSEDMSSDASNSGSSCRSSDISCPSPDSAIQGFLDSKTSQLEMISEIEDTDIPERSPDSGYSQPATDIELDAGSSGLFSNRINLKRTHPLYVKISELNPNVDYIYKSENNKKAHVKKISSQEIDHLDEEVLDIFNESQGSPEVSSRPDTPIEKIIEEDEKENLNPVDEETIFEEDKQILSQEEKKTVDAVEPNEPQELTPRVLEILEDISRPDSPSSEIEVDYTEGDIVWVWMKSFPIWPALVSRSPPEEGGDFYRMKGNKYAEPTKQYHCQFFGNHTERAWMISTSIMNWEENLEAYDQFDKITKQIIDKIHRKFKKQKKVRGKYLKAVKTKLAKSQEGSFKKAIDEVKEAFKIENIEERITKWGIRYLNDDEVREAQEEAKRERDAERRKSEPKKTVTKRKSILPKTHITPFDELEWEDNHDERNPSLLINVIRIEDPLLADAIPVLMPAKTRKEYKHVLHESRTITRELAERAISTLFGKKSRKTQKNESPIKPLKKEKKQAETPDVIGSKGDHKNVCLDCEEESDEDGGNTCAICKHFFHSQCQPCDTASTSFVCRICCERKFTCFKCKMEIVPETEENDQKGDSSIAWCPVEDCGKVYHKHCLENDELSVPYKPKDSTQTLYKCPLHNCRSCVLKKDDKKDSIKLNSSSKGKMFKCIRCPAAYHFSAENKKDKDDECVPAGSTLIAGCYIICPKHFNRRKDKKSHKQIHVNNCFQCFEGGNLVICERCPAAYHDYCLEQPPATDGAWYCPDCSKGSTIHYNDIVWAKIGNYRWWPSEVCHPKNIPDNIHNITHEVGEFAVKFLGTNDYYWLNQHRCFLYKVFAFSIYRGSLPFQKIIKNVVHSSFPDNLKQITKKRIEANLAETEICDCHKRDNPCDEECTNRQLQNECSSKCLNGDKCQNRRFTKRHYPPLLKFQTDWGGNGLKAKKLIPKGSFIIEYIGEIISHDESRIRLEESAKIGVTNYYILELDNLRMIDAGPRGNIARFINHSCDPNCGIDPWIVQGDTRIGIFSKRDIQEGEELTFNYQLQQSSDEGKTKCLCGSKNCAGFIGDKVKNEKSESQNAKKSKISKKRKQASRTSAAPNDTSISQVTKRRKLA
ncbi:unnamed protein product [Oikopleura dioica]|uniref:Histone-lysine N-methyltransferase n=1 Tax=Oikopleura dioica TaxID=34765 RepID=E4WYR8_OIKDI|nr:unnamed protein product [Oikopleura dioica]